MANRDGLCCSFGLPPEILEMVFSPLSKHDLTICVRVSKAWYEQFIDRIWHTVEIFGHLCFHRFMDAYGGDPANTAVSLGRNVHRIRVLGVYHIRTLNAFLLPATAKEAKIETEISPGQTKIKAKENELLIEHLTVHFLDDPLPARNIFRRIKPTSLFAPPLPTVTAPPTVNREGLLPAALAPTFLGQSSLFGDGGTSTVCFGTATSSTATHFTFGAPAPPPSGVTSNLSLFGTSRTSLHFEASARPSPLSGNATPPNGPQPESLINLEPLLNLLGRCKHLLSFRTGMATLANKNQFEGQAQIWVALPASLEELYINEGVKMDSRPVLSTVPSMTKEDRNALMKRLASIPRSAQTFDKLRKLTAAGDGADIRILYEMLMNRCPALDELSLSDVGFPWDDEGMVQLISQGSLKGWRTLGLSECINWGQGPQVVEAILQHAATLENLRISTTDDNLSSTAIQKLLCTAPKLKRFDTIPSNRARDWEPAMLLADDIINSKQGWVCSELESFKCMIGGIPRPDLQRRTNNMRLRGDLHNEDVYSTKQSQEIQRKVLAQLGQLTKLREITLGQDSVYSEDWDEGHLERYEGEEDDEEEEEDYTCDIQLGMQYECLAMTLEGGLDQLKDLKLMRRLNLLRMVHGQGAEEQKWMKENWPVYKKESRDSFWADRGHWVYIGDDQYRRFDEVWHWKSFDWW